MNATNYASTFTNSTDFINMLVNLSTGTNYFFGYSIIAAVFVITYISISNFRTRDSLLVASFFAFITAMFLFMLGMVGSNAPIITLILVIATYFIGGQE